MSDNLSTKDQAAVAEVKDAVVGLADSTTERNGTAGHTEEQFEDSNDASSAVADDTDPDKLSGIASGASKANASKANANVSKQVKGTKARKIPPAKTSPTKTSPKKRATGGNDEEDGSPKKKRAPAKAKAATGIEEKLDDAAVKTEASVNEEATTPEPADPAVVSDELQVPVTPMKGKRKSAADKTTEPKTPRTPKTPKASTVAKDNNETTPTPKTTPRKRSAADKVADKVSLPTSWADASEADKELVAMKQRSMSWNDIRSMWLEKTGQDTATSTLPNRYKRLQLVMMQLAETDKTLLATTKADVEANWKNKKWGLIATEMEKNGGGKYPADFLQKEWKKMDAARVAAEEAAAGGEALLAAAVEAVENDNGNNEEEEEEDEEGKGEGEEEEGEG